DGAVIGGVTTGSVTEDAASTLTASGQMTITDADTGQSSFNPIPVGSEITGYLGANFGHLSLTVGGLWSFSAVDSNAAIQALGQGVSFHNFFTVSSVDRTSQHFPYTLLVRSDGAVIGGVTTGSVTEDAASTLTASGQMTITDADTGQSSFNPIP